MNKINIWLRPFSGWLVVPFLFANALQAREAPDSPTPSDIKVQVDLVGNIPTDYYDYAPKNMFSPVVVNGNLLAIDNNGVIYKWTKKKGAVPIFDRSDVPDGVNLVPPPAYLDEVGPAPAILNVAGGDHKKLYVVFSTTNVPEELDESRVRYLPMGRLESFDFSAFGGPNLGPRPIFNMGFTIPIAFGTIVNYQYFQVLYEFSFNGSKLTKPKALAAFQAQATTRHNGGGMVEAPDGRILFATGDSLAAGAGGRAAPQQDDEVPGKLWLIDPDENAAKPLQVAAKGVRNVQHIDLVEGGKRLVFSDIGRTRAEEVNSIEFDELLDDSTIENFGWGCDAGVNGAGWSHDGNCKCVYGEDGYGLDIESIVAGDPQPCSDDAATSTSREGTFHVEQGFLFGGGPLLVEEPDLLDPDFIWPLAQYSRFTIEPPSFAVAVSGPVASKKSFRDITAFFSDLMVGKPFAITSAYTDIDATVYEVQLVDSDGVDIPGNSFNGLEGGARVDPRFFKFPDGTAGVIFESSGNMYRLTELCDD